MIGNISKLMEHYKVKGFTQRAQSYYAKIRKEAQRYAEKIEFQIPSIPM